MSKLHEAIKELRAAAEYAFQKTNQEHEERFYRALVVAIDTGEQEAADGVATAEEVADSELVPAAGADNDNAGPQG
jgi:hypothetical protein